MDDKPTTDVPLLVISNLSKKFCKELRRNMYYGFWDVVNRAIGRTVDYSVLRPGEFWVLKSINLTLYEGEILGVIGANGSGKTTLMRVIAQVYPNDFGVIHKEESIKTTAVFALRSGMEPLYTGLENIFLKGAMYGMSKQEITDKLPFITSFSELGDKLNLPFGNYSSGMRARLAFSIALATQPNIFILDEALAVGDTAFKVKCFEYLKCYVKEQPNRAVFFVTNSIRKINKIATRAIIMRDGEIAFTSNNMEEAIHFYLSAFSADKSPESIKKLRKYD